MTDTLQFHTWIKFNFNSIKAITHNENGYTAAYNEDHTIVVWKNSQPGPSVAEGEMVCVIIDQFEQIDQIQWVYHTDHLLIRSGDRLRIWDIFSNRVEASYFTTEPILYAKATFLGFLVVKAGGRFTLYKQDKEITSQITSDLVLDIPNGVIVYPSKFQIVDGEWVEEELGMSWGERGLRRQIEGDYNISINGDVINLEESNIDDLVIPEGYRYIFDKSSVLLILEIQDGYIIRTKNRGILIGTGPNTEAVLLDSNAQVFLSSDHPYYIVRSEEVEQTIKWKKGHLVRLDNSSQIQQHEINLDKLPPSMYFDISQDLTFARYNEDYKFIWFPDQREDYVFYDVYTQTGSIFTDMGREKHSFIKVSKSGHHLMIWNRGKHYPSGKLVLFDVLNPETPGTILYDETIKSRRINEEAFIEEFPENVNFPLIIPEWHYIELWVFTTEPKFSRRFSYAQYYLMLNRWSQSENAALLDYPEIIPEKKAYLFFGDLVLPMEDKTVSFENIAPEWKFHETSGLLAYYSIDGHCYVINTFDRYLLPVYSFESELPFLIKFSNNGHYLVYLYFEIRETSFTTHPRDGYQSKLTTEYPYITIEIHNISRQKSYHRSVRFPIFLDHDNIEVQFDDDRIRVFLPSYTDNSAEVLVMFNRKTHKFHQVNGADKYRLWMTHAWNSPFTSGKKGEEFPLEPHPEISRDYAMRPFTIYQGALVRKDDNHPISMADINLQTVPQQSTSQLYDFENTTVISVPFYYDERMKPIYIQQKQLDGINPDQFVKLSKINKLPKTETLTLDKVPHNATIRERIAVFVRNQVEQGIVHTETGISFKHPNYKSHYENIKYLAKKARIERFM